MVDELVDDKVFVIVEFNGCIGMVCDDGWYCCVIECDVLVEI